jgi:hypothetical protein
MSEQKPRLPLIALGAAVLAVAVSVIAATVVITRDDSSAPTAKGSGAALLEQQVSASDVVRLRDSLDVVAEAGQPHGVRVRDAELAKALGLEADDTLLQFSGRPILRVTDVADMIIRAGGMRLSTIYVELERDGKPALMRWRVEGSLLDARTDLTGSAAIATGPGPNGPSMGSGVGSAGVGSGSGPGLTNPFSDPLLDMLDRIEKIDETHYRVRRDTAVSMIREAEYYKRGARYVPSMKSGAPNGYKLFAIRPGSVFDKVGFKNADTVHAINGASLADVDDLVSLMNDAKRKVKEFRFDITRGGQNLSLHIELAP